MKKNIKKLKEEQKEKITTNVETTYEFDDTEFDPIDLIEVEDENFNTYELCEENQEKTGWFYPDEDEDFIDNVIDLSDEEI